MSLTKGSKVEASDWNNLADAYNSEIVDRRKVTNVKITGAQIEQQINSNSTIEPLIAGLTATTNGRMVNEDGSLSSNTYSVAKGRGTLIYPLEDHQKVLLQLSKISVLQSQVRAVATVAVLGYVQADVWAIVKILVLRLVKTIARELVKQVVLHVPALVLAVVLAVRVAVKVLVLAVVKIVVSKNVNQVVMMLVWVAKVLMQVRVVLIANVVIIQGDLYVSRWICYAQGISSKS